MHLHRICLLLPFLAMSAPPAPATGLFPGLESLETENMPLRLNKGDCINIGIDPGITLHKSNPLVGGVAMTSLSRWSDGLMPFSMETGEYTLPPALEQAFIDMKLPTTRFYAITTEEPFDKIEDALDAAALFLGKIHMPADKAVIELEDYYANSKFSPDVWADAVAYSLEKNHGFRFWEVGNEIYSSIWGETGKAFPNPQTYIDHFIEVSKAIKAVQPDALVGISVPRSNRTWGDPVLKGAAGHYDFACPHFYGGFFNLEKAKFEDVVISDNHDRIDQILRMNRLMKDLNPDRETLIYDTEWGLHGLKASDQPEEAPGEADFQPRNGNIMGTIYRGVRLVYYARENLVRGACGWKSLTRLSSPGFATLYYTEPERRTMLYWLYYYFNRTLQENVATISGTVPYYESYPLVPVVATSDASGNRMTIMLVNGSWDTCYPATITLDNFNPKSHKAVILTDDDLDAFPHLEAKTDFVNDFPITCRKDTLTFTMPAHSIVFLQLEQ